MAKQRLIWKRKPEFEDYEGARRYVSLLYSGAEAAKLLRALRKAKNSEYPRSQVNGYHPEVADGYHRTCAICYYDENAPIRCRMVSLG